MSDFTYSETGEYDEGEVSLTLPAPFGLNDYKVWRKALDAAKKEQDGISIAESWQSLLAVGKVTGVSDLSNPPLGVAAWAVRTADEHIAHQFIPKK